MSRARNRTLRIRNEIRSQRCLGEDSHWITQFKSVYCLNLLFFFYSQLSLTHSSFKGFALCRRDTFLIRALCLFRTRLSCSACVNYSLVARKFFRMRLSTASISLESFCLRFRVLRIPLSISTNFISRSSINIFI